MSLTRASLSPDDVVRRYVARVRADLEPDPLFRRRLRGVVTNRFVAAREGLGEPARGSSRMGRLGRACLYASFGLAMSVGGALAASRGSVPGDALYQLKLQVEAIRLETFPEAFRDDLMVYALSERMAEFGRLVEEGELARAAGLAETIAAGYHELAGMGITVDAPELRSSLAVLDPSAIGCPLRRRPRSSAPSSRHPAWLDRVVGGERCRRKARAALRVSARPSCRSTTESRRTSIAPVPLRRPPRPSRRPTSHRHGRVSGQRTACHPLATTRSDRASSALPGYQKTG
jgi:hypothetical protein